MGLRKNMMTKQKTEILERLFNVGVKAVSGENSVRKYFVNSLQAGPDAILSIGKAACSMYQGIPNDFRTGINTLIITKIGHVPASLKENENLSILESAHPIPDENSLIAGRDALEFVSKMKRGSSLLFLVSGGASSLVEILKEGYDLDDLKKLTDNYLMQGEDIATINRKRSALSLVKKGGLLSNFSGSSSITLAISDVEGDDINVIGSGIGAAHSPEFSFKSHIIASNEMARLAIEKEAQKAGIKVVQNQESLYANINDVAKNISEEILNGPDGLYIFGGEPTVELPKNPGIGGRNQALALLLAKYFNGYENIVSMVAGTDGTDGPTQAAGAIVDSKTYKKPAGEEAINKANSGAYLGQSGHLFVTGPTGTNVMDITLILKN